jgi:hypothetical protein
MDLLFLLARLLHIGLGVFWAGSLIFNAVFLLPAIRDAGPEGVKVAAGLMRRRFLDVLPVAAGLTVLSGLWLYWRISGGFAPAYLHSAAGLTYGIGGIAALIALGLGLGIIRPGMLRAAALSQVAAGLQPAERAAQLATAQAMRIRAGAAGRIVAGLLILSAGAMALGRYV